MKFNIREDGLGACVSSVNILQVLSLFVLRIGGLQHVSDSTWTSYKHTARLDAQSSLFLFQLSWKISRPEITDSPVARKNNATRARMLRLCVACRKLVLNKTLQFFNYKSYYIFTGLSIYCLC